MIYLIIGFISGFGICQIWHLKRVNVLLKKVQKTENPHVRLAELELLQEIL